MLKVWCKSAVSVAIYRSDPNVFSYGHSAQKQVMSYFLSPDKAISNYHYYCFSSTLTSTISFTGRGTLSSIRQCAFHCQLCVYGFNRTDNATSQQTHTSGLSYCEGQHKNDRQEIIPQCHWAQERLFGVNMYPPGTMGIFTTISPMSQCPSEAFLNCGIFQLM